MGISIDSLNSAFHNVEIKTAAGQALAIDGSGFITISNSSFAVTDGGGSLTVDGTVELGATTLAALETITISNTSFAVTATDLDIRDLVFATDKVDVSGSSVELGATTLAALETITISNTSFAVTATDLDIRNLVFATDKVDVSGSSITTVPAGYSSWATKNVAVTTTAGQLDGTPLSGRLSCVIQNLGSKDVYLGPANTVTSSNGLLLPKGSSQEILLDDGADIWAITASGTADIRLAEYAN